MQDRYAGDTPDFGKYLLLTHLQNLTAFRLGVNWYRTRPEEVDKQQNSDGGTRHHARLPRVFKKASPEIFEKLLPFENQKYRSIENLESAELLNRDTVFFSDYLSYGVSHPRLAKEIRSEWNQAARCKLQDCPLIFCDPDTGPSPPSMIGKSHHKKGPKYSDPAEIAAFLSSGQSVVVIRFIRQYRGGIEKAVRDTFKLLGSGLITSSIL